MFKPRIHVTFDVDPQLERVARVSMEATWTVQGNLPCSSKNFRLARMRIVGIMFRDHRGNQQDKVRHSITSGISLCAVSIVYCVKTREVYSFFLFWWFWSTIEIIVSISMVESQSTHKVKSHLTLFPFPSELHHLDQSLNMSLHIGLPEIKIPKKPNEVNFNTTSLTSKNKL